ncbi:MAG: EAL domain-containing protein [Cohaesibacter sp.]|nr:EAL domain-containing protein [Cohaesibacter sp.]
MVTLLRHSAGLSPNIHFGIAERAELVGMFFLNKSYLFRILAILLVFLASGFGYMSGLFAPLDNGLSAFRMGLNSRTASASIVLLEIDNKSLSAIGSWPWKRSIYADIVDKSFAHGAEELAFDIDFSAQSHDKEDLVFAKALETAPGPVTLAIFQQYEDALKGDDTIKINRPIDMLSQNTWAATVNVLADNDGIVRRFPYAQMMDGELTSSLAASLGGYHMLHMGDFLIDMSIEADSVPVHSVIDLLEGRLDADLFKGKKVIVGAGAAELRDTLAVPVYGMMTGPLLQVIAAEALLQGRDLQPLQLLWLIGLSLGVMAGAIVILLVIRQPIHAKLLQLLALGLVLEFLAFILYLNSPYMLQTAFLQIQLFSLGVLTILMDVRVKSILLSVSRKYNQSLVNLLETIVEDSFSGILICEQEGDILEVSEQARILLSSLGYDAQKGETIERVTPPGLQAALKDCFKDPEHYSKAHDLQEVTLHRPKKGSNGRDWEELILEFSLTPSIVSRKEMRKGSRDQWVATLMFRDVTKVRQEQRRLAYLVDHDDLTGLFNEAGFCQAVDQAMIEQDQGKALILAFEVRRLDKINRSLGADYGDLLLQQISKKLKNFEGFDLLGCGTEREFLVCKLGAQETDIPHLCAYITDLLETPLSLRGHQVIAGSYIGVADFQDMHHACEEVSRAAIVAMNRSKEVGGTYLRYSSDLAADVMHRRVLEREIIDAVDRQEFEMHYQPQVSLANGQIIGCEALIRWKHRDLGMIRPDLFIPIMEETGMILDVGRWILEQVCKDAATWDLPINVAANVSAIQFSRSDILDDIDQALKSSQLDPARLQVEITESLFISDPSAIVSILKKIQKRGIPIALDDFGTGYSSLSYIHQFPLDKIKIDQAFVKHLPASMDSMAVINAIVALARNFDMDIVAEGVETAEQWEILRLAGCHIGQGWHFGKPMPNADFAALLSDASQTTQASHVA